MFNVEKWDLSRNLGQSKTRGVTGAPNRHGTLPQVFHVDPRTYVAHPAFKRQLDEVLASAQTGYIAIVRPSWWRKSTFLTAIFITLNKAASIGDPILLLLPKCMILFSSGVLRGLSS